MMTKFMNKQRGLLAAIMALVMVFAGAAFVAAEVDADTVADTKGPLSFTGDVNYGDPYGSTSNVALGNDIKVTYVDNTKTYTVTGALAKQIYDEESPTTFSKLYGGDFGSDAYGIAFNVTGTEGTVIGVGNGSGEIPANGTEACLMYLDGTDESFTVTVGENNYTVSLQVEYCTVLNAAEGTISEIGGSYIINGPNSTVTFTNGIKVTNDLLIHVPAGQKLVVNGYGICGSGNEVDLTLAGDGEIIINASTANGHTDTKFSSVGIAGFKEIKIEVGKLEINATGDKSAGITGKNADGGSGTLTINGTVADITGTNRGIYVSSVTIQNGAKVTASGYERGITYGSNGTITVDGANTELEGKLLTKASAETEGENDRMGLKIGTLEITNGATVKAQAAHISSSATIAGTFEIIYNKDAGRGADTTNLISAVPAGLIIATEDDEPTAAGYVMIVSGKLIVDARNAILGTIKTVNDDESYNTAVFGTITTEGLNVLKPIIASSDVTITKGSIYIDGELTVPDKDAIITISDNSDVTLTGTVDKGVTISVGTNATITVPAGETLTLDGQINVTGENVNITAVGDLSGNGTITETGSGEVTIKKAPASNITVGVPNDVQIGNAEIKMTIDGTDSDSDGRVDEYTVDTNNVDKFEAEIQKYTYAAFNNITIAQGVSLEIPAHFTLDVSGTVTVTGTSVLANGADTELIIYGKVIGQGSIIVQNGANLYLDGADVRVVVDAKDGSYVSVTNAKKMSVSGNSTADLGVGYGNTLVLADLTVPSGKSINAYGTVIIDGTVTVEKGAQFNVYASGSAQIDGNLIIAGIANIYGDSEVAGTVKVQNDNGNAAFNVYPGAEVTVTGTMDVLVGKNKAQNLLTIEPVAVGSDDMNFVVEGTLNITGTLDGTVYDMGTVAFNGTTGANAKIVIFDGMSITIASVIGQLVVEDSVGELEDNEIGSKSNTVTLNNVRNVTVSTEVTDAVEDISGTKTRFYTLNMTVSGTIAAVDDTKAASITVFNAATGWTATKADDCNITIGDITLGKNVDLRITAADAVVEGTVTVSAEGAGMTITGQTVDVLGTIVNTTGTKLAEEISIDGNVNASKYVIEDTTNLVTTYYYTTLEAALAASATDSDKVIEVLGTTKIASDLEVPAGITLDLATNASMTIDVDGKLTVVATALLDASAGSVKVDGMLVIMDKETGLDGESKLTYQVYTETETSETYSGLVLALKNAVSGDVITVVKTGAITKSVTIPEGVTLVVPKTATLSIGDSKDDVVLTVAGTLKVEGTVSKVGSKTSTIEVPGVVVLTGTIEQAITIDDYVAFEMKVDGRTVDVMSNLAYAAENAVNGDVYIIGDVTGGDVTFTQAEKGDAIAIQVTNDSALSVGTLTLVGNGVSITTKDAEGTEGAADYKAAGAITGTVAAAAGSMDLVKVSNITIAVTIETDIDGTTDYVTVTEIPKGSFTVASGTVTTGVGFTMTATKDNAMSVAAGATLVIGVNNFATDGDINNKAYVIVDGTISIIEGGNATIDDTVVNGTIDVASKGILTITSATVNGTISVAEKTDDAAAGTANVSGALILGTAPALGANGVLSGPIGINSVDSNTKPMIIAYAGADVSAAVIDPVDGVSKAKSSEIVINGVPYMTVYVDKDAIVSIDDVKKYVDPEGFNENTLEWADEYDGAKIGDFETVEGTIEADYIGLTVSAGVGLKVYIDGLSIENYTNITGNTDLGKYAIQLGTHTVSFAVESGYDGANATITVNGVAVSNNGTFTVDVDDKDVVIIASGAVPAQSGSTVVVDDADDGMALTDILLIVLVVLIVIMAIIVALRMMRS